MSFLALHFDPDIFVSYSHGAPKGAGSSLLKSWTHALLDKLKDQIQSLDTEFDDLVLWFDREIDPTAQLTEALRQVRRLRRPPHHHVEPLSRVDLVQALADRDRRRLRRVPQNGLDASYEESGGRVCHEAKAEADAKTAAPAKKP